MRELDADRGVLALHEGDQRLEALDLRVVPDAEVVLVDQADFLDAGGLDKDHAESAERVAAEMDIVKDTAGAAGPGAIMHHRRHDQTVLQRQITDLEGLEQQRSCGVNIFGGRSGHGNCLSNGVRSLRKRFPISANRSSRPRADQRMPAPHHRMASKAQPVSAAFTRPLALPKSIWPANFARSKPITLPMSFIPAAPVSAIAAAIAAFTWSSDICLGR